MVEIGEGGVGQDAKKCEESLFDRDGGMSTCISEMAVKGRTDENFYPSWTNSRRSNRNRPPRERGQPESVGSELEEVVEKTPAQDFTSE